MPANAAWAIYNQNPPVGEVFLFKVIDDNYENKEWRMLKNICIRLPAKWKRHVVTKPLKMGSILEHGNLLL